MQSNSIADGRHRKGLLVTTLGVLILTPDALLVRLTALDLWSLAAWRGLSQGLLLLLGLLLLGHGKTLFRLSRSGLLASLCYAVNSLAFIYALGHTTVANALVIFATTPLVAAAQAWLLLRERIAARTLFAMLGALAGIAWVVSDSLGSTKLDGDIAAFVAVLAFSMVLVLARRDSALPMVPAVAWGSLGSSLLAWLIAAILNAPFFPAGVVTGEVALYATLNGAVVALSFAFITWGPRFLPAAQVGLLMLLETVISPLWVWLGLGEVPSNRAFEGGAVVLLVLVAHSLYDLKREQAA